MPGNLRDHSLVKQTRALVDLIKATTSKYRLNLIDTLKTIIKDNDEITFRSINIDEPSLQNLENIARSEYIKDLLTQLLESSSIDFARKTIDKVSEEYLFLTEHNESIASLLNLSQLHLIELMTSNFLTLSSQAVFQKESLDTLIEMLKESNLYKDEDGYDAPIFNKLGLDSDLIKSILKS